MNEGIRSNVEETLEAHKANVGSKTIQRGHDTEAIMESHLQCKRILTTKDNEGDATETANYESTPQVQI